MFARRRWDDNAEAFPSRDRTRISLPYWTGTRRSTPRSLLQLLQRHRTVCVDSDIKVRRPRVDTTPHYCVPSSFALILTD